MQKRQGEVKLKVKQAIFTLGEFTTKQLIEITNENESSVKTCFSRLRKKGFIEVCGRTREPVRGRPREVFRVSSKGEDNIKKDLQRLNLKKTNKKSKALIQQLWSVDIDAPNSIEKSSNRFVNFGKHLRGSTEQRRPRARPNIAPLSELRELLDHEFQTAQDLDELKMLALLAEDHITTAALELDLNLALGPGTDDEEIIYGYLLGELGKTILSYGAAYIRIIVNENDLKNLDNSELLQWGNAYEAIEEAITFLKEYGLTLDIKELKEFSDNFYKEFQNLEKRFPGSINRKFNELYHAGRFEEEKELQTQIPPKIEYPRAYEYWPNIIKRAPEIFERITGIKIQPIWVTAGTSPFEDQSHQDGPDAFNLSTKTYSDTGAPPSGKVGNQFFRP